MFQTILKKIGQAGASDFTILRDESRKQIYPFQYIIYPTIFISKLSTNSTTSTESVFYIIIIIFNCCLIQQQQTRPKMRYQFLIKTEFHYFMSINIALGYLQVVYKILMQMILHRVRQQKAYFQIEMLVDFHY